MRNIVIEKVIHADGKPLSLVDQIDVVLKEISFELGKLADEEKEPEGVDCWVDRLREEFWKRQIEIVDYPGWFRIRMAAPGFANGVMHLAISESGIEVSGEGGVLLRRIPLTERIDPHTVSAVFDDGYLQVAGAKLGRGEQLYLVGATGKRSSSQAVSPHLQRGRSGRA